MTERLHLTVGPRSAPNIEAERGWRRAEAQRLLTLTEKYFDSAPYDGEPEADFEDFIEDAYRLDAALTAADPDEIAVRSPRRGNTLTNLATRQPTQVRDGDPEIPRYGGQYEDTYAHARRHGAQGHSIACELIAERYAHHRTFQRRAGRRVLLAGSSPDDGSLNVPDAILQLVPRGGRVVVKVITKAKYLVEVINVPPEPTKAAALAAISRSAGLVGAMMHLEGRPNAFLVQEHVPELRFEYRVFVVNHQPVTAAGCIEEHTPLDADADFSEQLREHRQARSPVERRPEIAHKLLSFARDVVADYREEVPSLTQYVLDVALDGAGHPLVVELNGLLNAGLYASNPYRVAAALTAPGVRKQQLLH